MKKILIIILMFFAITIIMDKSSFSNSENFYESKPLTEKEFKQIIEKKMINRKFDISFISESDEFVTREKMAAVIMKLIELLGERKVPILENFYRDNITDINYAEKIYREEIINSYFKGILNLGKNNEIRPKDGVTY